MTVNPSSMPGTSGLCCPILFLQRRSRMRKKNNLRCIPIYSEHGGEISEGTRRGCEALLDQCISPWNGALYTRQHLLQHLRAEGETQAFIDFWVFHPDALTEAEIQTKY